MDTEQKNAKVFIVELGVGKRVRSDSIRNGRGFSRLELKEADITLNEARLFSIPIDVRRKTAHDFNISHLKELLEEERARVVKAELEKEVVEEQYKELLEVRGIGLASAQKLIEMGVASVEELAGLEVDITPETVDISTNTLRRWIRNAKKHLGEEVEEEEELEMIEEKELEAIEAELDELEAEEIEAIEEEPEEEVEAELDKLEEAELEDLEAELEKIGVEEEELEAEEIKKIEEEPEEKLTEAEKQEIYKELMQVRGIGQKSAQKLVELGVTSIEELAALEVDITPETEDVSTKTLRKWIKDAQKYLERKAEEEESEEITDEELERIEAELDELEDLEEEDIDSLLLDYDLEE
jgi:predicted flap endonuclease-1-like 5' DNA nuclease